MEENTKVTANYGEGQIQVLEGLDPVRKRPGMYIGSTDERGLHHIVQEIVDNSIDEALSGYCDTITVIFNNDGSCTVKDNGRGIPAAIHPKQGINRFRLFAEHIELLHIALKHGQAKFSTSVQNKQYEDELPVCGQNHLIARIQNNGLSIYPTAKEVMLVAEISLDPVADLPNLFSIHFSTGSALTAQAFQILNVIQQFAELLIIK